jgi:putative ABC transport system permease protein
MAASFAMANALRKFLFGIGPTDPLSFAGVGAVLAVVAVFACYLPARRATRVDPIVALNGQR